MVNNTVYQFIGSNLGFEIFLKKREHHKKGCIEIEDGGFSVYTLCIGVSRKFHLNFYSYVLAKILKNGAKFIEKLTPGFKDRMRNLDNFREAVESPKS